MSDPDRAKELILLLGGARSGKSHFAETWARAHGQFVLFVATAQALDGEMQARIARHRDKRPPHWRTLEAPTHVGERIRQEGDGFDTVIVDCITLLASNVLRQLPEDGSEADYSAVLMQEIEALLHAHGESNATWLLVSNEVGMGIVPPYPLGRRFRDGLGWANQQLAAEADQVVLLVAGLPWHLKPVG
jgi:adenosylcobinamide kinase/adenosylcobinamide-phosphate guanylyltransferase